MRNGGAFAALVGGAEPDPDALADTLLGPLAPELFKHQRAQGLALPQIKAAWARLAVVLS